MSTFREIGAVTAMGLHSIPRRLGVTLVIIVGIAVVVAVLICVLGMARGFGDATAKAGHDERAIVLGQGAQFEAAGGLSREHAVTVMNSAGVRRTKDAKPIASAEQLTFIPVPDSRTGRDAMVTVRGIGPEAFLLRPEMKIVAGRAFRSGVHEVIVGRALQRRIGGLQIGRKIILPQGEWTIVGVFESNRDAHESELLTDLNTLIAAYRRGDWVNSVTVRLQSAGAFKPFKDAITTNPTLQLEVKREKEYFAASSERVGQLLTIIAYVIGGIMALGAVFAALNTMYSAISARSVEIATLRAIGFGATSVVVSVFIEALLLALTGAVIGAALAWLFFNGTDISTTTGITPSQMTYALTVDANLIAVGVACAFAIGLIGGLFPAIRAARLPVAVALRPV